jgi:urease accessory protein
MKTQYLWAAAVTAAAPAFLAASATPAFAHHPMGGTTPETVAAGLLSGIGHPIIGIDHLAFVIAVGLAVAFTGNRFLTPLAFVAATIAGCLVQVAGTALPVAEIVIAASIVALGILVLSGRPKGGAILIGLFAVAGLFHGWAYGESIVGAESAPLLAYLVGFAAIQYALALAAGYVALRVWHSTGPSAIQPRLAGALIAGIGVAFLVENLEALILA